ncbi:MAG TPA: hypothetical protein VGM39_09515 [Kofleriaceae bacterium]|jgi:hypothetical protein
MQMAIRCHALLILLAACGSSGDDLTDATELTCPAPGALPFKLKSHGFVDDGNANLVKMSTRIKDEASDWFGNPDGVATNVYIADSATPTAGSAIYQGAKARTKPMQGVFQTPLSGENVSLWTYDGAMWNQLARGMTDENGAYDLDATDYAADDNTVVYSMLEADGSCGTHYNYRIPRGSKVIVTDIDGTLTTDDAQIIMQVGDETYDPAMVVAANTMLQAWSAKGYPIVYLTARAHLYDAETREWLDAHDFPKGPVITSNGTTDAADAYKTIWMHRVIDTFGWTPYAVYGNADTDITAYANVTIPLDKTFIVGPLGGTRGTVAIPNLDFTQHISAFVNAQPNN